MKRYLVRFMPEAEMDVEELYNWITFEVHQPLTANRYITSLNEAIRHLVIYADAIALSRYDYIQSRYGPNARHITYKKMAIIYTITGNTMFIKRVIAAKLIR
ncbi:MAG: type II toxin-antitoxin system RelE/ParE family toxin [Prevotellaceae bacterium]|jgi:plasmid stabilization system protein ParE|nr:type II toxin-antitoxin system RelE/ParE family toxin [Prevotellaceae bacterium]